jgi:MFS family permease
MSPGNSLFSAFLPLLPFMLAVFIGFLPMGMALPVLPRYVHDTLGQGTVMVGVVMGSQFAASLFARLWAGSVSDARGARVAALAGLMVGACVGVVYLVSTLFTDAPRVAVGVLVAARLLVGLAEGFFITAILAWGVARLGPAHAGKVIGWVGVALFAAYGAGAPLGVWVMERFGFAGLGVAALLIPLVALAGAWWFIPGVAPGTAKRLPVHRVIGAIRLPGLALTLTAAGFAMINAFVPLLFAQRGWGTGALAFTSMGAGFILARMLFGHLPDKLGGAERVGGLRRRAAHGRRLRHRLPGLRRRGGAAHAAAKPRLGDGRVCRIPGCVHGPGRAAGWGAGAHGGRGCGVPGGGVGSDGGGGAGGGDGEAGGVASAVVGMRAHPTSRFLIIDNIG